MTPMRRRLGLDVVVLEAALGAVLAGGCLIRDPNHCANQDGDATCAAQGGGQCSACVAENNGCVMETPEPACHAVTSSAADDDGTGQTTDDEDGSESDTGGSGDCASEGLDDACPEDAPYCDAGACTRCDDAGGDDFCAAVDPGRPACLEGAGICVACTADATAACPDDKPFCSDSYVCSGCTEHSQCPESACNLRTGACIHPGRVWWVDQDNCPGGTGTVDDPYCDISTAIANVKSGESGVVKIVPGASPYAASLIVTANQKRTVAILGAGGKVDIVGDNWGLNVSTHDVFAHNLVLLSGSQSGVRCTNHGNLWLDDSVVDSNAQGVFVDNCTVRIRRSRIVGNAGDGVILTNGAHLTLASGVIGANGDAGEDTVGLRVTDSTFEIRYGTIAHNFGSQVRGILCSGGEPSLVRNSVVVGPGLATIACEAATFENSVVDTAGLSGTGNVEVSDYNETWFSDVEDLDFHVRFGNTSPFRDVAIWDLGDPSFDLDRAPRPGIPGTPDFAGADVP